MYARAVQERVAGIAAPNPEPAPGECRENVTPSIAGTIVGLAAIDPTTFSVTIGDASGQAGVPQTFYWQTEL